MSSTLLTPDINSYISKYCNDGFLYSGIICRDWIQSYKRTSVRSKNMSMSIKKEFIKSGGFKPVNYRFLSDLVKNENVPTELILLCTKSNFEFEIKKDTHLPCRSFAWRNKTGLFQHSAKRGNMELMVWLYSWLEKEELNWNTYTFRASKVWQDHPQPLPYMY